MLSGGQLAGGNSTTEKADNDYYATDPKTTKLFLDRIFKDKILEEINTISEPSCGEGFISEVLKEYFPKAIINSTDLIYRSYGEGRLDFLSNQYNKKHDLVITNPPFSLINEFINKGLESTNKYLIFLGKIQLLETKGRKNILENSPLKYVYVHSNRQATWKNGKEFDEKGKKWATTMCLAWFVWDKEYKGEPIVKFI